MAGRPIKTINSRGREVWRYERRKPDASAPPSGVWYALVCNPNAERKALRAIEDAGLFLAYLPSFVDVRKIGGHRRQFAVVERPVFPGYLFVASKTGPFQQHTLAGVTGVYSVVRGPDGRAFAIDHAVIAEIMARDCAGKFDLRPLAARNGLTKPHSLMETGFEAGEVVRATSGPMEGLTGKIEALASGAQLRVLMDIFGRPTAVDIDVTDLEAVA